MCLRVHFLQPRHELIELRKAIGGLDLGRHDEANLCAANYPGLLLSSVSRAATSELLGGGISGRPANSRRER
jgi:hypothetical protein